MERKEKTRTSTIAGRAQSPEGGGGGGSQGAPEELPEGMEQFVAAIRKLGDEETSPLVRDIAPYSVNRV